MPTSSDEKIAINIQHLTKSYRLFGHIRDIVHALNDVSFQIYSGETIGIIGPNGSGKSTLLKILSEITAPDKGNVHISGKIASILEVGTGFNPDLSGRKNIYLNARLHGMKKNEVDTKFDAIVQLFGFPDFLDTPVKQYSSGMYMRLAFAVVVHIDADIFLFDEIMSVGDLKFQKASLERISELQKSGKTICIVTHNPTLIADIVNRMILLSEGKLAMAGVANEVIYLYKKEILKTHQKPGGLKSKADANEIKRNKNVLNPKTKNFDLTKASLQSGSGQTAEFNAKDGFDIVLAFQTDIADPICLSIFIGDCDRRIEVLSYSDKPRVYNQNTNNKVVFSIPPGIFNEIHGYIGIGVLNDDEILIYYEGILRFRFTSKNKMHKTIGYFSPHVGVRVNDVPGN